MVYRGKLSKACAECRAKKTRCDAAKPTCGQCKRARRKCSGYRNLSELRLVDQSFEVSTKLSSNKWIVDVDFGSKPSPSDWSSSDDAVELVYRTPSLSSPSSSEDSWAPSSVSSFSTPTLWAEGNARSIFFDQFILVPGVHAKTDLGFVTPIYDNVVVAGAGGMLESIVSALGLSVVLKTHKDKSLRVLASQKYSTALKQTQLALQNPRLAKSDETLATVLLLGLHELVAVDNPETDFRRHSVHLEGSIRLLQLRGHSQMDNNWGGRMLHRVCHQVTNSCLYSRTPIPASLMRLLRSVSYKMHREEISGLRLMELCARLCNILSLPLSDVTSEDEISISLQELIRIDKDLVAWPTTTSWRYDIQRIPVESPDKSFLTQQDIYLNHITGASWNRWRSIRIKCAEEIISISQLLPPTSPLRQHASPAIVTITSMTREICQSAPFFLGEEGTCWNWQDKVSEPPTMFGASSMLMPLHFAASNPQYISPSMQEWILSQIGRIADAGVAKARQLLEENGGMRVEVS